MEEAIANLKRYGLYRPFSNFNKCPEGVYDTLKQIWCDLIHRHHEGSVAKLWDKKVHFEETTILPDKKRDAFVKNLRVVGSFAVHNFHYILEDLKQNERAKLVREPDNPHDPNAIRVEAPFIHGEKLGYIPRADAEVFAPEIDAGIAYAAWISSVDRKKQQVFIDIYRHIQFSLDDVTGIRFIQNGYKGPQLSFDLSLCRGKLVCKKRDSWGAPEEQQIELTFARDCMEKHIARLQKCNLPGWHHAYHNYSNGGSLFWALEIRRKNASRIRITGCNDYPEEWEAFMEFINGCLDLNKTKGDGKVFMNTIEPPLQPIPERRI
ncbi:MAG: HIRAN domain-containing protein [Lentisphaeria bacterium]|nr:HIRAN domain-containing protein [Lentisphaeria bacterium]